MGRVWEGWWSGMEGGSNKNLIIEVARAVGREPRAWHATQRRCARAGTKK